MARSLAHHVKILCCLMAALFVSGCLITSDNPILPSGATGRDPALYGTWYGSLHPDDDPFFLHFLPFLPYAPDDGAKQTTQDADTGPMTLLLVFHEAPKPAPADGATDQPPAAPDTDAGDSGWGVAKAYAATIKGTHYLSVRFDFLSGSDRDEMGEYHLYLYKINESGQLVLNRIADNVLANLIEKGTLAGEVSGSSWNRDGRVTASSAELVKVLEAADPGTLVESAQGMFRRIEP